MPITKIQAESMNLADTYAFTGTVSGTNGAWNLLNTQDASSSSTVAFTSTHITDDYNHYVVVQEDIVFSIDGADGRLRYSTDNGSTIGSNLSRFIQISYDGTYRVEGQDVSLSSVATYSSVDGVNSNNNGIGCMILHFFNLRSTTKKKLIWAEIQNHTQGGDAGKYKVGHFGIDTTSAVNYLRFELNNGVYTSGKFKLYGVS